jgi:hypothetical protein
MFQLNGSCTKSSRGSTPRGSCHLSPHRPDLIHFSHCRIRQLHESHNVLLFFPPESEEQSSVLLVYDPTSPSASPSPVEKAKNIGDAEKELIKWAKDAADVKSQVITVERKWHSAVIGKGGTTLNA